MSIFAAAADRRLRCRWLTILALLTVAFVAAGPVSAQISDDFSAPALDLTRWRLVDPRGDGQLGHTPGQVSLTVPAGHDHAPQTAADTSLRLLQDLPDADFSLEARFHSLPVEPGQEQGLLAQQGDGTAVRFFYRHDGDSLRVSWQRLSGHRLLGYGEQVVAANDSLALRLTRSGDQWTCAAAHDGQAWFAVFSFSHVLAVTEGGLQVANRGPEGVTDRRERDDQPTDKAATSGPAPAFQLVADYFFDTAAPIVPEDGSLIPRPRTYDGLQALYLFTPGTPTVAFDFAGSTSPHHLTTVDTTAVTWLPGTGLRLDTPTLVTSPRPATRINQAVMAAGAVTLEAWLTPATVNQSGPARILSISADPSNRNVSLSHGQWGTLPNTVFNARLRTTTQGNNGQPDLNSSVGSLTGGQQHVVYTRAANGAARIYVDGVLAGSGTAAGDLSTWDPFYALALGGELDGSRNWLGTLHLAAIYARDLSAAEVTANHLAGPRGGTLPALAPAVVLSGVVPGSLHDFTETITLSAVAGDADGTVAAVEFRSGDRLLFRDETPPYTYQWSNPSVGGHQLRAVAFDDAGLQTSSEVFPISVSVPFSFLESLALSDAFFDAGLGEPWLVSDLSGGAAVTQNGGSVFVAVPGSFQSPWTAGAAVLRADQAEIDADVALELMIDAQQWLGDGFAALEVADSLGTAARFVAERRGPDWFLSWGVAGTGPPLQLAELPLGPVTGPLWLQLRRTGATCTLLHSRDGLNWLTDAVVNQPLTLNRTSWLAGATAGPATVVLDHAFNLARPILAEDGQAGDTTGPVISQLKATPGLDQLVLDWVTDEMAYYRLQYGLTTGYELGLVEGGFFSATHRAEVVGLSPGTAYHLRLTCLDIAGNVTVSSDLVHYTDLVASAASGPVAGDVYRETILGFGYGDEKWRVTDPGALNPGAAVFLPNPTLTLNVPDLTGAVRAELIIDRWGGHPGTIGKKVRLNRGSWLHVPDPTTIPGNQPECWVYQDNPTIALPLEQLVAGPVALEGDSGGQTCYNFDWGQWGWYGVVLRVYYDGTVARPDGSVLTPTTGALITDSVEVALSVDPTVDLVQVLARYQGFDSDGDGRLGGWHGHYRREPFSNLMVLNDIVGAATAAPWTVTWNAEWVPDQAAGSVGLQARLRSSDGVWYVTEVDSLSLDHSNGVVKAYSMQNVPASFWVRTNAVMSATFSIPAGDSLGQATAARLAANTWNGADYGRIAVNGSNVTTSFGRHHHFSSDAFSFPTGWLTAGTNTVTIAAPTVHHGLEMLWPGPLVSVRYGNGSAAATAPVARIPGDVDGNGRHDDRDARAILAHLTGAAPLAEAAATAADMDGNGRLEMRDAVLNFGGDGKSQPVPSAARLALRRETDRGERLVIDVLEAGAGPRALELLFTGPGLEDLLREFEVLAKGPAPYAWHVRQDTLRYAGLSQEPGLGLCALQLAAGADDLIVAGTLDGRPLAAVSHAEQILPTRFELVGNFPNPFNPETTIAFNLPRPAVVRLRVHDLRGNVVAVLADGAMPAGRHQLPWQGRDRQGRHLSSGAYVYRLEADGQVWTRKLLLLK